MAVSRAAGFLLLAASLALAQNHWQLVWGDEFDGPGATGSWRLTPIRGGILFLDGSGNLMIRAEKSEDGYTSARLHTQGKFEFTYGKVEARIKEPFGQSIWPAFWMLGAGFGRVGWPACGEVDIMENIGREPATIHGTVHGPGYSGAHGIGQPYDLPGGARFADDFH